MNSSNISINRSKFSVKQIRGKAIALSIALIVLTGCAASGDNRSTGEVVDDSSVATRLKTALLADGGTSGLDIEVEAYRGRVQLIGFLDSQAEIDRAEEIARNTRGVTAVSNALAVVEESRRVGQYIDDTVLLTRVTRALVSDPIVSAGEVEIEINRGVVILGGFVGSDQERETAGRITQGITDVERVLNNLQVR